MKPAKLTITRDKDENRVLKRFEQIKYILGPYQENCGYDIVLEHCNGQHKVVAIDNEGAGIEQLAENFIDDLFNFEGCIQAAYVKRIDLVDSPSRVDAARKFKIIRKRLMDLFDDAQYTYSTEKGRHRYQIKVYDDITDIEFANRLIEMLFGRFETLVMDQHANKLQVAAVDSKSTAENLVMAIKERVGHDFSSVKYNDELYEFYVGYEKPNATSDTYNVNIEGDGTMPHTQFTQMVVGHLFRNFDEHYWKDRFCTPKEIADQLSITKRAVNQRIQAKKIRGQKIGKGRTSSYLIPRRELERLKNTTKSDILIHGGKVGPVKI